MLFTLKRFFCGMKYGLLFKRKKKTIPFTVLFYPNEILLGPSEIIIYQSEFEFYLREISLDQSERNI